MASGALAASRHPRKQLAGPPEEFDTMALPDPAKQAVSASSAVYLVGLGQSQDTDVEGKHIWSWEKNIAVDSQETLRMSLFTPANHLLHVRLTGPDGKRVHVPRFEKSFWENGDEHQPGRVYTIEKPATGMYNLKVVGLFFPADVEGEQVLNQVDGIPAQARAVSEEDIKANFAHKPELHDQGRHGLVIIWNNSTDIAWTHLSNYNMKVGEEVQLMARMTEVNAPLVNGFPAPRPEVVNKALLEVLMPDGSVDVLPMHDDGLHGDGQPDDGVYAGSFKPTMEGHFNVQAFFEGQNDLGAPFIRTSQHVIRVVSSQVALTGKASGSMNHTSSRLNVHVGVSGSDSAATYRVYTQVWGVSKGQPTPVAWISTLVDGGTPTFDLELDLQWVQRAAAVAPFTLKEVLVQDIDTMDILDQADAIPLALAASVRVHVNATIATLAARGMGKEITREMREGVPPAHILAARQSNEAATLLMVHGYCTDKNPFQVNERFFDNAIYFLDPKNSVRNDPFAQKVLDFVAAKGVTKYSCAGFSQGGMVCTHIFNYYFSAMDSFGPSPSGRLIQSLATPFLGNSGASVGNALVDLFGGCPANADLTLESAALWGSGITTTTASQLYSISTQYKKSWTAGYCNLAMNMVLNSMNDGATELDYAHLPGSTWVSHDEGWCHTEDSKYPVSWSNTAYLKTINENAARF